MTYIICQEYAPPEVNEMLHEFNILPDEVKDFMGRTLEVAMSEGFTLRSKSGTINSRTAALMFILQAKMLGEEERASFLSDGTFVNDYTENNSYNLENWDGLILTILFASDELLERFIAQIPVEVRSSVIGTMEDSQQTLARKMFLN